MRTITEFRIIIISIGTLFLLTACSHGLTECTNQTISNIAYADRGQSGINSEVRMQVGALTFAQNEQTILVVYVPESSEIPGRLVQLQVPTMRVARTVTLGRLAGGLTRMSGDTTRIVSAVKTDCPSEPSYKQKTCWSLFVWNTLTGGLVSVSRVPEENLRDVAISTDGKWLITAAIGAGLYNPEQMFGGVGLTAFQQSEYSLSGHGIEEQIISSEYTAVAFNSTGRIVAYGLQEKNLNTGKISGAVGFQDWDGEHLNPLVTFHLGDILFYVAQGFLDSAPLRLAIDPSDHWLAVQSANNLELREIKATVFPKQTQIDLPLSSSGVMAFNPSSSLIAVGHAQGVKVLRVPDLKVVLDKRGAQTTALTFSPDGCWLAWGDTEGTVHIANAPKP